MGLMKEESRAGRVEASVVDSGFKVSKMTRVPAVLESAYAPGARHIARCADERCPGSFLRCAMAPFCHFFLSRLHARTKASTLFGFLSVSNETYTVLTLATYSQI